MDNTIILQVFLTSCAVVKINKLMTLFKCQVKEHHINISIPNQQETTCSAKRSVFRGCRSALWRPTGVSYTKVRLFTDDTIAYLDNNSELDSHILQNVLDKLAQWEKMWDINFQPDKCEVLRVGLKRQLIPHNYILHDQTLQLGDTSKYLGVTISSKLSWNSQIDNITGKANSTLAFLIRNLQVNSPNIRLRH